MPWPRPPFPAPGPSLDDLTLAELDAILVRLGLADRGRVDPGCGHLRRA